MLAPLHDLLHKRTRCHWTKDQENTSKLLVHCDIRKDLVLAFDASQHGSGDMFSHPMKDEASLATISSNLAYAWACLMPFFHLSFSFFLAYFILPCEVGAQSFFVIAALASLAACTLVTLDSIKSRLVYSPTPTGVESIKYIKNCFDWQRRTLRISGQRQTTKGICIRVF